MLSTAGNHQAQLGSAEILVLRFAEELLEFWENILNPARYARYKPKHEL